MRKMYFIGVTTGASSIHRVFPRWARLAGTEDAVLAGLDIPVHGTPEQYRAAVRAIREDPDAMGALVTTHKVGIYNHARELFTNFDADGELLGEVSCIVKRGDRLSGLAVDTLTAGLALRDIIGPALFRGHALILGAGGAGLALACHLFRQHQPARVILSDVSRARIDQIRSLTPAQCVVNLDAGENDRLLAALPLGALVVNATGMGKDRPGAPITDRAWFPPGSIAWDFNYRGDLLFLDYARAGGARAVDGWDYFLHGWSQIMARVFGFDLTPALFAAMKNEAVSLR